MGTPNPNYYAAPHVGGPPPAVLTGYRLVRHFGAAFADSPDVDAATWATVKAAAQQGFSAFDAAAALAWGSWYTAWPLSDRAAWHAAVKAA